MTSARQNAGSPVGVAYIVATQAFGGPERQIIGVLSELDRSRFDPVLISFTRYHGERRPVLVEAEAAGLATVAIRMTTPFDPRAIPLLARALRRHRVGIISPRGYKADLLGLLLGRLLGLPVVATCGGWTGHTWRVQFYERVDRMAYRFMDAIVAVSEATRRQVIGFGARPERVRVVPNAVDGRRYHPGDGTALRAELGIAPEATVIAAMGRLSPEKGHRYLVEAFAQLPRAKPLHLLFVGDGPERSRLEELAASRGVSDVTFAGWQRDMAAFYRAADLVALPSLAEGLPNAVLEAMACAKPIVASDVGGVGEVIRDGETGLLVRPSDAAALRDALSRLVEDPSQAAALAQRAHAHAGGLTFTRNARLLETVYRDVLDARRSHSARGGR